MWHEILETAIQSPSPHNVQPWRVKILDETNAELYIDSTRTLPKEDITGSFVIMTMGMFLEAIKILAAPNNLALNYELQNDLDSVAKWILENKSPSLLLFARMNLTPSEICETDYAPEIFYRRRTSRVSLLPEKMPHEILERLKNLATEWNHCFEITSDKEQIEKLLKFNTEGVFEDLNTSDYHDEIVEWFRFSNAESQAKLDGLDYRCMNTSRLTFWLSARHSWMMQMPLLSNLMAKVYRKQLGEIPTIGVLSGKFWSPVDAIETGKFLIRFWLETAVHSIYIHPFGNLVTNPKAAKNVFEETGISEIWLVFKIGFSSEPPKSHRLPVDKILVK